MKDIIQKVVQEIIEKRAKIIDDFCKFYLASQDKKYFLKLAKDDFRRVEMIERRESPTKTVYSFRLKKGPLPQIKTQ